MGKTTVWLATTNLHKVREIRAFFQNRRPAVSLLDLRDLKNFLKDSNSPSLKSSLKIPALGDLDGCLFKAGGGGGGNNFLKRGGGDFKKTETKSLSLDSLKYTPPEETGLSFKENARIKSTHLLTFLKNIPLKLPEPLWILGEDSGLEVTALKGCPGIYSARYSGPGATDQKNNRLLLKNLKGREDRTARYVCALSCRRLQADEGSLFSFQQKTIFNKTEKAAPPDVRIKDRKTEAEKPLSEKEGSFEGFCYGSIALEERGKGGFGYDPVFIPRGESKTLGELPSEFKEKISHRVQALKRLTKNFMPI